MQAEQFVGTPSMSEQVCVPALQRPTSLPHERVITVGAHPSSTWPSQLSSSRLHVSTTGRTWLSQAPNAPFWQASNRLFDEVLAADPTNANRMRNVALTEKNLGGYFDRHGDLDRALAHYLRALALDERRVQAQPSDRQAQIDLAIDIGSVGHIHEKRETYAEAIEAYRRSLEIRQRLSKTDSADVYARGREAFSRTALARVYLLTGSVAEAREHAERAVALNETLGHLGVYAAQVGTSLTQLADVQQREGRARAACDTYGRAVRAFASVERPDGQQGDAKAKAERAWAACQATLR